MRVNIIHVICRYYFLVQFNNNLWWVPCYWIKSSRTEKEAVLPNKVCRCIWVINTLWCIKHRPLICHYAWDWLYRNSTRFVTTTVSDYSGHLESRLRIFSGKFADMFVTNTWAIFVEMSNLVFQQLSGEEYILLNNDKANWVKPTCQW